MRGQLVDEDVRNLKQVVRDLAQELDWAKDEIKELKVMVQDMRLDLNAYRRGESNYEE